MKQVAFGVRFQSMASAIRAHSVEVGRRPNRGLQLP